MRCFKNIIYNQILILTALLGSTIPATAQAYPTKPVRIIAASTGTSGDLLARYLGQRLSEHWGQPVVIENRSGAGAVIAAEIAAKAAPDGYTVHLGQHGSFAAAPSLYKKLSYDPLKDFAPITHYAHVPLIIVAHPSLAPATVKDLIEYVKARPGAINYSSGGAGGAGHLNFEMMNHAFGLKFVHVPYKGIGAALTAVMSGEVQLSGVPVPVALPQVKAGKVKAYAITSKNRFAGAPDIPTVAEAGFPGFDAVTWFAMFAPARTPADIVRLLNRDMVAIINTPSVRAWLISQGTEPAPGTPEELTAFLKSDIEKWGKVIRAAGIRAE
jgi:tripartite-type tricarboxylate transporter receptor subunit TctC